MKVPGRSGGRFSRLLKAMAALVTGPRSRGGVDAGREAFVSLSDRERKQKQNLLRKLNLYRSRKKTAVHRPYGDTGESSGRRRTGLLALCLAGAVALFVLADGPGSLVGLLANFDFLRISSIEVQGCNRSSAAKVRSSSGITVSTSLLAVDGAAAAERIRRHNPWVDRVAVVRHWPDELQIVVEEYEPHALIALAGGDRAVLYYLDRDGTPFIRAGGGTDLDYPVITGLEQGDEGERPARLRDPLEFLRLIGANNPNLPAQSVSEIHVDDEEGLVVHLVEYPFPIFFGSGDIRNKYFRLRKVLEVLYKPRKTGMDIAQVAYIRMNYLDDKVIVGYSKSG